MDIMLATMCYIDSGDSFLMLKRNKKENDIHEGLTISVGGKFEPGESPEDCIIREVKEETNLDIISPKLRGIITFPSFDGEKDWYTYVFTATEYTGSMIEDCNEGELIWVKKTEIQNIKTWEGDYIFLDWLVKNKPFFSAKFNYKNNKFIVNSRDDRSYIIGKSWEFENYAEAKHFFIKKMETFVQLNRLEIQTGHSPYYPSPLWDDVTE